MRTWKDGNNEIWNLAKRVHGWGRIHAIEQLEPETNDIRRWLLTDGVRNEVMYYEKRPALWQERRRESDDNANIGVMWRCDLFSDRGFME